MLDAANEMFTKTGLASIVHGGDVRRPPKQKGAKLCLRDAKVFVNGLAGIFYQGQEGGKARFGMRSREPPKVLD